MKQAEFDLSGFQINVDLSKGESSHDLSGLFQEDGQVDMPEASDFENIGQVSPFLDAFENIFCANEAAAYITEIFVVYADLLLKMRRKLVDPCWTDGWLHELQYEISIIMEKGCFLFGR